MHSVRRLITVLMMLTGTVGLFTVIFVSGPKYTVSSYTSTSIVTAINPELILDYNTYTASCASIATSCYQSVSLYTTTEIWSAESTFSATLLTTNYLPLAVSEVGVVVTVLALVLFFSGVLLLARSHWHSKPKCN